MIRIRVTGRDGDVELCATGHAGYGPFGQDIVCAGVSALLYGLIAYLTGNSPIATAEGPHSCGLTSHTEVREADGELWVRTHGTDGRVGVALEVTLAGLSLIARQYPAYVTLDTETYWKGDEYEPN